MMAFFQTHYAKHEYHVPMRDGVKLFTAVYTPVAKEFKVYYKKVEGKTPTSYTMDHSAANFVFDTKGHVRLYSRYDAGPQALASDLQLLLKSDA